MVVLGFEMALQRGGGVSWVHKITMTGMKSMASSKFCHFEELVEELLAVMR